VDATAGDGLGIAATRVDERMLASTGLLEMASTEFGVHNSVMNAGVLLSLPALISQGLMKATETYQEFRKGYYSFVSVLLLLAFMALSRVKNPEQLKKCKPGELGKILGLDRVPETRCLRKKLSFIVSQEKANEFGQSLSREWITKEECLYFYIDGHMRVYNGYLANLPKKYVSRQKLCLAGTAEYWINNQQGLPFMVFTGQLSEKLKDAIIEMVPRLIEDTSEIVNEGDLLSDPDLPRFTIIFDREAYEPAFFARLWKDHKIAVTTYRKNVKDKWDENEFYEVNSQVINKDVSMLICEHETIISDHSFREIRKLGESGHQTSIITTNKKLTTNEIAGKMFSRWSQENFFGYMMKEFDFDKMIEYGVETLNDTLMVVNPLYSKASYRIKKLKEKKTRIDAKLLNLVEQNIDGQLDQTGKITKKQAMLKEKQMELEILLEKETVARKEIKSRIFLTDMSEEIRYNKLKLESKLFMNTIKMISYRAETALVNIIRPYYKNTDKDGRQIIQSIMQSDADLLPDYNANTLTVTLHSLSTPRANFAAGKLCMLLNQTETIYPQTNLKMIFKNHYQLTKF